MTTQIAVAVFKILSPLLLTAITWAVGRIAQLVKTHVQTERVRSLTARVDDTVLSVVKEINQVSVEGMKSTSADGKLPAGVGDALKQSAIAAVRAQLGPRVMADLTKALSLSAEALERLLATKVEAAVYGLKRAATTNGVHPAATTKLFAA
jgi:hypothetical protein